MPRRPTARAAGALLVSAILTASLTQPAVAAEAATDVPQAFTAHSGDSCRMGVANGTIVWHLPPDGRTVDGNVAVVDRPVPDDPAPGCGDDGRYTILLMTAFVGNTQVDQQRFAADNGSRESTLRLTATRSIETVVVKVCRSTRLPGPPTYCGTAQSYHSPVTRTG
jgi:hypothetical protein